MSVTISTDNGQLVVSFSVHTKGFYDLVTAIKTLPYSDRRWDANRKVWLVDPKHATRLTAMVEIYTGEIVDLPKAATVVPITQTRIFEVRYIGACKQRNTESMAYGLVGSDWRLLFPETVLRAWFDDDNKSSVGKGAPQTLYQVLGVKQAATAAEIKTAFRRMALQWHPDVCREPNAAEMFMRVQDAHSLLSDTNKRARYDAGLELQARFEQQQIAPSSVCEVTNYRSPLRCGLLMVQGIEKLGRLEVSKIMAWEDITHNGKTLVTSWPAGAKEPVEIWA